ncbi:MAG: L-seryl-tRNA(Sec) selenium transferase [Deltaproteobacteria bacterium]|nr:MAG: L-seryl-tRNA(Sec) selenium transferase [Deltaproteobacteria bacterium]
MSDLYRALPNLHLLLESPALADLPRELAKTMAHAVLDELRAGIRSGEVTELPDVATTVAARTRSFLAGSKVPVINATGVVVHTNLGRAPWPDAAIDAAQRVARYTNLEMSLESGQRGGRLDGIKAQLRHLTGAEDGIVVNNCAAAVLLALTALARDREVVVSRGELVEIGGSFRVPDVISAGGARLVAVGTTNRTHLRDYEHAIGPSTAVLLKVHPSNFRVSGFTAAPAREAVAGLARAHGLVSVEDLGSGSLDGRPGEPAVRDVVATGIDLVTFSGDKLLGGPQAGLIVGKAAVVARLRKHPLYRALRVDKVTLAAVEATLAVHSAGEQTPVDAMLGADLDLLHTRAMHLHARLAEAGITGIVTEDVGYTGGGALPGQELPTWVVELESDALDALAKRLRTGSPAVVARLARERLVLDVRTVRDDEIDALVARVASAIAVG